ncbi:hypothetical protein D3C87_1516940 [compost metagenome]
MPVDIYTLIIQHRTNSLIGITINTRVLIGIYRDLHLAAFFKVNDALCLLRIVVILPGRRPEPGKLDWVLELFSEEHIIVQHLSNRDIELLHVRCLESVVVESHILFLG